MKIFKFNLKTIGQILFVIIFLSTTPAKSLDKFNKAERVSDYFSGILLLNDNQYEQSFEFLKRLNGLENSHLNYSIKYLYSLVNSGNFREAFNYSRKLEKKNLESQIDDPKIIRCDAPVMKISSSFIRKAISENKDVRYLLTPEVYKYVDEMNFYKKQIF